MPSTLADLVRDLERAADAIPREVMKADGKTLDRMTVLAHRYSSGTLSLYDLSKTRPYAKRHGAPLADPTVINKHTGNFEAGWIDWGPIFQVGIVHCRLSNSTPEAVFLKNGTKYAFARPIDQRIVAETADFRLRNIRAAVSRALRKFR